MTIARAQMYRQLYQLGGSPTGIATMPMDYGQSLQVNNQSQMPAPNYSSAQSITSNPLLNYGQTQLANGGGTPLTMQSGGITRLGYQEGGMGEVSDQNILQQQNSQIDPQQALEIIIQMLIAQGISPEEAKKIALQMVQAVAEGGIGEMEDERIEARFGGRINNGREQYGLGSIFKGAAKAVSGVVKGVTNAVKSVVKSPIGKAALTAAALYFAPYALGAQSAGLAGYSQAFPGISASLMGTPGTLLAGDVLAGGTPGLLGNLGLTAGYGTSLGSGILGSLIPTDISGVAKSLAGNVAGGFLGGYTAGKQPPERKIGQSDAEYQAEVDAWKMNLNTELGNTTLDTSSLYPNNPFYPQMAANGGRIGYQEGGIGDLISQVTKQEYFGTPMMATGGRIGYAMGAEVPTRENQAGITELDYRQTGGFVPPIGIKEKADDIPAMLSNNEFVFTADAVRNAGDGDVNQGAKRMYKLMKKLESGGRV